MAVRVLRKTMQASSVGARHATFVIQAENRGDVLARIVLLFHRLNVEMVALYFVRRKASETMGMSVTVEIDREGALRMEAHLYKVAHVTSVKTEFTAKDSLCSDTTERSW